MYKFIKQIFKKSVKVSDLNLQKVSFSSQPLLICQKPYEMQQKHSEHLQNEIKEIHPKVVRCKQFLYALDEQLSSVELPCKNSLERFVYRRNLEMRHHLVSLIQSNT